MTRVYLCEKPSQAREIAPYVGAKTRGNGLTSGQDVVVTWCVGHLLEQATPETYEPGLKRWDIGLLPVLPRQWRMQVRSGMNSQYQIVAQTLKKATEVVIATDPDREGEVIAREVMELCGYRGPVRRLMLSAFDATSIKTALGKLLPGEKTYPMYLSGLARSRADWLAGMNLTMGLSDTFGGGGREGVMHCGRVQTPTLALIVRRERTIAGFVPKSHYVLKAIFEMQGVMVPVRWHSAPENLDAQGHCVDRSRIDAVANKVRTKAGRLCQVKTTREAQRPPLPYSLGSLQQDASKRYGLKAQAVLDACQALYEKHKATTYPRTDSEYLPESMLEEANDVLQSMLQADPSLQPLIGLANLQQPSKAFTADANKVSPHHAIIPTRQAGLRLSDMSPVERTVYELVRRRYLAQFLGAYEFNKTVIELSCEGEQFGATGTMPLQLGWHRAYENMVVPISAKTGKNVASNKRAADSAAAEDEAVQEVTLPSVREGDQVINRVAEVISAKTNPPKRYTEGTLLAAMESIDKEIDDPRLKQVMKTKEKAGIGTDATRAGIIEALFKRSYIANEGRSLVPTDKGNRLIGLVEKVVPEMADPVLTAMWEEQFNFIEKGTVRLESFEGLMGQWLQVQCDKLRQHAPVASKPPTPTAGHSSNVQGPAEPQDRKTPSHPCPECGKSLILRSGRSGAFMGCSGYPSCRHISAIPEQGGQERHETRAKREDAPGVAVTPVAQTTKQPSVGSAAVKSCQACGKPMALRKSAKGPFYGCSGFPVCRNTQSA
jgi:DNA topoisomerase-3